MLQTASSWTRDICLSSGGVNLVPGERQRLLVKHRLDHHVPRQRWIDAAGGDQVLAVGHDGVGVLHDLEPLEVVGVMQPHASADDLQDIDDAERPVALMRAKLAVIDVIDHGQRIDAGCSRSFQLGEMERPLVVRKGIERIAHQADGRLAEARRIGVIELHAREHVHAVGDQTEILDAAFAPLVTLFNHGNVKIAPALDCVLRWLVVTPDMHRVHHSIPGTETDSNFGFVLPRWDRLFGTCRAEPAAGQVRMVVGIESFRTDRDQRLDRLVLNPVLDEPGSQLIRPSQKIE